MKIFVDDFATSCAESPFEIDVISVPRVGDLISIDINLMSDHFKNGYFSDFDFLGNMKDGKVLHVAHEITKDGHKITIDVEFEDEGPENKEMQIAYKKLQDSYDEFKKSTNIDV